MNDFEVSSKIENRMKVAVWSSVVIGLLIFYVFGYFPLLMWAADNTSLLDSDAEWFNSFLMATLTPLFWLTEIFPFLDSYYDQFIDLQF